MSYVMPYRKLLIFLLATTTLGAGLGATRAADLDMPMSSMPEQQVTFGSGWYIRGDIAATKNYAYQATTIPRSQAFQSNVLPTSNWGYDFSLGGGYAFTNNIRGDILVDFHQPSGVSGATYCVNSTNYTCWMDAKFRSYDALANAYYDFGPFGALTPYVGAGVGVAFGQQRFGLSDPTGYYIGSTSYHNLAWALMAGAAIDIYAHTKLDIGYRYVDNGKVQGTNYSTHLHYHEIRAGIRYMIDN